MEKFNTEQALKFLLKEEQKRREINRGHLEEERKIGILNQLLKFYFNLVVDEKEIISAFEVKAQ